MTLPQSTFFSPLGMSAIISLSSFLFEDKPQILRFLLGPIIFLYTNGMQDGDLFIYTLSQVSHLLLRSDNITAHHTPRE